MTPKDKFAQLGMIPKVGAALLAVAVAMTLSVPSSSAAPPSASSGANADVAHAPSHVPAGTTADGRRLFRGIFFGHGPVADQLVTLDAFSTIQQMRQNNTLPQRKAVVAILNHIEHSSPNFFATFSKRMRSGDPYQVEKALRSGGDLLDQTLRRVGSGDPRLAKGTCFYVAVVVTFLAAGNVYYAVNAAQAANVVYEVNWFWSSTASTNGLSLQRKVVKLTELLQAA